MKKIMTPIFFLAIILFSSCEFTVKQEPSADNKPVSKGSKIRNGIELKTTGDLKVSQAFLLFEDGSLVPSSNEAKVNQEVNLRVSHRRWIYTNQWYGGNRRLGKD